MYGYIYMTTNLINGRKYIGQKKSSRFLGSAYFGSGKILRQAIEKYGFDNFKVKLIEECNSKEELNLREQFWISKYNASHSRDFYNICKGGESGPSGPHFKGHHHSEETRRLMSELSSGRNNANYGNRYRMSDESRKLMSSERKGSNNPRFGIHCSEETISKISESLSGRIAVNNGYDEKRIYKTDLDVYLSNGYKIGALPRKQSESTIAANSRRMIGRVWINNGSENKFVHKEDVSALLSNGWSLGRIKRNDYRKPICQ
jgi:group I intron endonuclease